MTKLCITCIFLLIEAIIGEARKENQTRVVGWWTEQPIRSTGKSEASFSLVQGRQHNVHTLVPLGLCLFKSWYTIDLLFRF